VSRELNEPIVEWTDNKTLLTGAFLGKLLFGQGVPNGLPTQQIWKHFSLYYDGQFDDPLFIASGFNQLQRACCICNLARITSKNLATLNGFIQLPVTTGCDLWSVMYGTVSGNYDNACNLFQQFCVKELTVNI
jgi:hypothetical protein